MTPQQVQSRIGKPVATQGRCWLYPQPVDKYLAAYGVVKSVLDVCFLGGRLSDTEGQSYIRRNGKLVIFKPPPPKLP
jgi:hypothetical protein